MEFARRAAKKCERICERLYPRDTWATQKFRQEVLASSAPERTLLDVGCGRRPIWLKSVAHSFGASYGIDPVAEERCEDGIKIMRASAYEIPLPTDSVDVIAMRNVAEHLDDPVRALRECMRILHPGGSLFILTPNKWFPPLAAGRLLPHSLRWRLNSVLKNADEDNIFPAYYRANTARVLAELSEDAGFITQRIEYFSERPVYFTFSTFFYRSWAAFDRLCLQKERFAWLRHYVFCRLRAPK